MTEAADELRENGHVDTLVVGAGFAGLYAAYRLRESDRSFLVIDAAAGVGGTWYWNRYPGARCDVPSVDYSYSFDPELESAWTWSEKYATQPEILAYLNFVADRYELRRHIALETRLHAARWDANASRWVVKVTTDSSTFEMTARIVIMATGTLSVPKDPELPGAASFVGDVYLTGRWPHEDVDFSGQRVAVVGTGSSAIQSIPLIADQADQLTVYQRTPNFSMPARNGASYEPATSAFAADRDAYRHEARWSRSGMPVPRATDRALDLAPEERLARYEQAWQEGHLIAPSMYVADLLIDRAANDTFAEFVRDKIREIVTDPQVAEALCPKDFAFGTKRPCLDTDYYATFNRDNVELVDLRVTPVVSVTPAGIETSDGVREFDAIVYATGFDAMTGAIVAVDFTGRSGETLADTWQDGPETYLGLTVHEFPNLFTVTGPGSPSVLSNMAVSIEQHVDFIYDTLHHMDERGFETIEPTSLAQAGWTTHVDDTAALTLFPGNRSSWYMGGNVEGKTVRILPYVGGVGTYREYCDGVVERGYLGFEMRGPSGSQLNDGVIARLQPDVKLVLEAVEALDLPSYDTMDPTEARATEEAGRAVRPPGPEVGEVTDGTYPGADGELGYRLYRPASAGPHPLVVYFHGGGWVLGDATSDDAWCRVLCERSDSVVVSLDYRHAPWHRFPAAAHDAWAGLCWAWRECVALGGDRDRFAVAGWSAGGNLAAVVAQRARDARRDDPDGDHPRLRAQVLITPVTDGGTDWPSYRENASGYLLTADLMRWFVGHYLGPDSSDVAHDPTLAPLHGDLADLAPACVVTCEFDPLRDEGQAYAQALQEAGNQVVSIFGRGQLHTSVTMVGIVVSAESIRQEIAMFVRDACTP